MFVDLHIKCQIFLPNFKSNLEFFDIFIKVASIKLYGNVSSESYADMCGKTGGHCKGNGSFLQSLNVPKKSVFPYLYGMTWHAVGATVQLLFRVQHFRKIGF